MTRVCIGMVLLLLSSQVGTQVAAWQYRHAPALGPRLTVARYAVYPAYGLYQWTYGLLRITGTQAFDTRLRLAWTAWGLTLFFGLVGLQKRQRHTRARPVTRWATRRSLRKAGLLGPHGVVLGRVGRTVVRDDADTHTLVVGPTRSGKGENTVLPTLLSWTGGALVYDPKGELFPQTAGWRQTFSQVIRCNPTNLMAQGCDLLEHITVNSPTEHRDTDALMTRLADPDGTAADTETPTGKHFRELTITVGQGLVMYALRGGHTTLPAIAQLLYGTPLADLAAGMMQTPHAVIQSAGRALDGMDDQQLWGLLTTVQRAFKPFLDPGVARLVSRTDFALRTLRTGDRPVTVYYTVPFAHQEQYRGVTRLFFHTLFDAALADLTGWRHRLLVLLDEVTTLRRFPLLIDGFDFAAGYGIKMLLLTPSLNRIAAVHGPYHNFFEGAQTRLIFPPNTRRMATQLAPEAGEHLVTRARTNQQVGKPLHPNTSVSTEETWEPLLSATALAQMPRNKVLLLTGETPPAMLTKIRAWKERPWRNRRGPLTGMSRASRNGASHAMEHPVRASPGVCQDPDSGTAPEGTSQPAPDHAMPRTSWNQRRQSCADSRPISPN
jgi:type IV secretion system protein VirD4